MRHIDVEQAAKRVCLVTPAHLSANPRLVKEADALIGAGYDVIIVAGLHGGWAEDSDKKFVSRGWQILRVPYGRRAGILEYGLQTARRAMARVSYSLAGLAPEVALHPVAASLKAAVTTVRADLYIAHNLVALPAAAYAARCHRAKLGFDAEDFHSGELQETFHTIGTRSQIRDIERKCLPLCDYITASSPGIARAYAESYLIEMPQVILNVFPLSEASIRRVAKVSDRPRRLYWFSQTIGLDRGLQVVIEGIAASKSRPHLYLRGNPTQGCRAALIELASGLGILDNLHFLSVESPSEMVHLASEYDVGLASELSNTFNRDICLTNKIFTYLLAGIPVLASDTSAQAEFVEEAKGAAFLYSQRDPGSIADAIDRLLLEDETLRKARDAARSLAQTRFNWEVERAGFLGMVAKVLGA